VQVCEPFPHAPHDCVEFGVQAAPHVPRATGPLTQAPAALHVCGVVPVHWVALGTQLPAHTPALQT
jgi:hypothetical protein